MVLEISSDEEVGWESHDDRGITDGGGEDHNWIAELLDEVNRDDCGYDDGGDDDSDEVVLVREVLPSKKSRKKLTSKSPSLIDLDDDCVILDHNPDKAMAMGKPTDNPIAGNLDDDSDDLVVVSEKGQVACRDYPHPRHLCIKFPFSSTPNQSHCDQCYCYVCDSLAPCLYWGNGSAILDHCLATEKNEFWKLERQNSKKESKLVKPVLEVGDPNWLPPVNLTPPTSDLFQAPSAAQNQVTRPSPIQASPNPSNFGVPNMINQNRTPFPLSRNKYQSGLVSQQLIKTTNFTNPRDRGQPNYNLAIPFHGPVFKRTGSGTAPPAANRHLYSSYRDSYRNAHPPGGRNPCRRQDYRVNEMVSGTNVVNTCGSFSLPNLGSSTENSEPLSEFSHQPSPNTLFEFSSRFQPEVNLESYIENPVVFQPHLVASQPQEQSFVPNYAIPCEAPIDKPSVPISVYTQQGNEAQQPNIDPKFFHGIDWPISQSGGRSSLIDGTAVTNESNVSGGLVDYEYDNWGFDCEAGDMEIPGDLGSAFMDTGTIFEY